MAKLKQKHTLALFFLLLALGGLMETIDIYYNPLYSHAGAVFIGICTVTLAFAVLAAFFWKAGASQK